MRELVDRLRALAQARSDADKWFMQGKSLRQTDNPEGRRDLYQWVLPEQTDEWDAAALLERQAALLAEAREALERIANFKLQPMIGSEGERSATLGWNRSGERMARIARSTLSKLSEEAHD